MSLKRPRSRASSISQPNPNRVGDSQRITLPPMSPQINNQPPPMAFNPQQFPPPHMMPMNFPFIGGPPPPFTIPPPGFVPPPPQHQSQQDQHNQQMQPQEHVHMHNQHLQMQQQNLQLPDHNLQQHRILNPLPQHQNIHQPQAQPLHILQNSQPLQIQLPSQLLSQQQPLQRQPQTLQLQPQTSNTETSQQNKIKQPQPQSQSQQHIFFPPLPPPPPPPPADDIHGVMVPFICPPPPYDMEVAPPPPLPFPPPNYIPYPLIAAAEPPSPTTIIKSLLDASSKLPKVDMTLASAAGSLFDLKKSNFNLRDYEQKNIAKQGDTGNEGNETGDEDEEDDSLLVFEMAKPLPEGYLYIRPRSSDARYGPDSDISDDEMIIESPNYFEQGPDPETLTKVSASLSENVSDIISGNGNNREKRRQELVNSYQRLTDHFGEHEDVIYHAERFRLQERLKNLMKPLKPFQVPPSDSVLKTIPKEEYEAYGIETDDDIITHEKDLAEIRDHELIRARLYANYELIKNLKFFYHNSDEKFKELNDNMVSKLNKLKGFFEYQKNQLLNLEKECFDVSNPKSEKLFHHLGNKENSFDLTDVAQDIPLKDNNNSVNSDPTSNSTIISPQHSVSSSETDAATEPTPLSTTISSRSKRRGRIPNSAKAMIKIVKKPSVVPDTISTISKGILHDFMPLVSDAEFQLITGDNKDKPQYMKFINKYDTSGSDTSYSTAESPALTRRSGRNVREGKEKDSESAMFAKIMKHFEAPTTLSNAEIDSDFASLGIVSKWATK